MRLPSVKTLRAISLNLPDAQNIRRILEEPGYRAAEVLATCAPYVLCNCGSVEHIARGHNDKSPAIDYVNCGDPYINTLMYVHGRGYVVGCWGDIVERGEYD